MRRIYHSTLALISLCFLAVFLVSLAVLVVQFNPFAPEVKEPSVLSLRVEGVITDTSEFIKTLRSYRDDPNIRAVVVHINSPGGLVGSSQELYSELKRVRDEARKPVVVAGGSVVASGAYYAASAADRIVANPGTVMGAISVLNQGAMLQEIVEEVHGQFKLAVQRSRRLSSDVVEKYADGRVFTGETAVRLGFADQVGTYEDALRIAGKLAGLGSKPKLFQPPAKPWDWRELINPPPALPEPSVAEVAQSLQAELSGKPLFLMPGIL